MECFLEKSLFEKILKEFWGKWVSIPIIIIISGFAGIPIIISISSFFSITKAEGNISYSQITTNGIITVTVTVFLLFILNIFYFIFVYKNNRIPKAKRNKTGIIIQLDAPNKDIYTDTKRKFGKEFEDNLFNQFQVIFVPYANKSVDYKNKQFLTKFLKRKRSILYLNIRINTDKDVELYIYDMHIYSAIIHREYLPNVEKEFQKIFSSSLKNFQNIVFPSKEMIKKLKVTATEMSLSCQYVIGLSLFLNGDLKHAEILLDEMIKKIASSDIENKIKTSVQKIRYNIFYIYVKIYSERYQRQCNDENALDKMNEYLEKTKQCEGENYDYCLQKAYYYIAKEQNSVKAKYYINLCKQMNDKNQAWKYSEAFLKAYDNKTIGSIYKSYKDALKIDYNIPDLIVFIEMILIKETNRFGLYLALGILYNSIGDTKLSIENIEKYLNNVSDLDKAKEILIKKGLYYEK